MLLGKLSMSEWAIGATNQNIHYGDVHNPWDTTRVSGGSSGGSGAAIGADLAAATLGTDTGGSVRIPAALNGCCGLRPTAGRVSNRGSIPVAWTFDTIGPLARRAEDVAVMLHVIAGYDHDDPVTVDVPVGDYAGGLGLGVRGLRVGVLRGWQDELDADLRARLEAAAAQLEGLGAELVEVELTGLDEAIEWTAELLLAEAAWVHRERLRDCPEIFADDVLHRLRRGESISGAHYGRGREWQRAWRRRVLDTLVGLRPPAGPERRAARADGGGERAAGDDRRAGAVHGRVGAVGHAGAVGPHRLRRRHAGRDAARGPPVRGGSAAARGGRLPVGDRLASAPTGQRRLA